MFSILQCGGVQRYVRLMVVVPGTEDRYLDGERRLRGSDHVKQLWEGEGIFHAVDSDAEPEQNAETEGLARCGLTVWLLRRDWANATRPEERCPACVAASPGAA